ncbi:MAG: polyprenyl synthetase family protein [bacterium]|nr:polyprenyl synthetase family protein [bacterium]
MLNELSKSLSVELDEFNKGLKNSLVPSVKEYNNVLEYIYTTKGKQIRPIIGILAAKMLGEFSKEQNTFLQAIELIHNATLFHDDIIDEADTRRSYPSLNKEFSNSVAVLSGDYFLACAIKNICSIKKPQVTSLFADYMKEICEGEIEQNLSLNTIPTIEKYLDKTGRKTALLFSLTLHGIGILSEKNELSSLLKSFGKNLGMVYQLQDDIKNFSDFDGKPVLNDLKSGIITLPIIFLYEENKEIKNLVSNHKYEEILSLLNKSDAPKKSKQQVKNFTDKAIANAKDFPENNYKMLLLKLLAELGN